MKPPSSTPSGWPLRKRLFDLGIAFPVLILIAPVMLLVWLGIRLFLGKPVLFKQVRPGYLERPFVIYKFRTMRDLRNAEGKQLPDEQRLSRFGSLLRRTSLDELPELWNVVKGNMSLVGPRPLLQEYLPLYSPKQRRRHEVPPGITGWAQIRGRNAISWEDKFELDIWYADHRSLWLDIRILLLTLVKVIRRDDITHAGHVTMSKFSGSR